MCNRNLRRPSKILVGYVGHLLAVTSPVIWMIPVLFSPIKWVQIATNLRIYPWAAHPNPSLPKTWNGLFGCWNTPIQSVTSEGYLVRPLVECVWLVVGFQPIWKICHRQIGSFPQGSGWTSKIFELPPPSMWMSLHVHGRIHRLLVGHMIQPSRTHKNRSHVLLAGVQVPFLEQFLLGMANKFIYSKWKTMGWTSAVPMICQDIYQTKKSPQ